MEIEFERTQIPDSDREHFRQLHESGQFVKRWPEVIQLMLETMASMTVALSLTEKHDNLLMWAHYARNHEGFVVGFDTDHSFFKSKGKGIYRLTKVAYSANRPNVALSKLSLVDTYFTKGLDWEYEQEWRLFADVNDASEIKGNKPYPICLFDLPAEAIAEVIVGCRANNDLTTSVSSILNSNPRLRHVTFKKAVINEKEYKLDIVPIET
ncbi:MAG: DUF2971 domain-containing protein [Acidobacteriota bacterium]